MSPIGILKLEMAGRAPGSPKVEVFMMEEETLWAEWENEDSE